MSNRPHDQRQSDDDQQRTGQSLSHGDLSRIKDIRPTVPVKHNQRFMLISDGGDILRDDQGQGLFYHDMRYLTQLELRLGGKFATALLADASRGAACVFELSNPEVQTSDGQTLDKQRLSIQRSYTIEEQVTHRLTIHNFDQEEVRLDLRLDFSTDFTDLFVIRGQQPGQRGQMRSPAVRGAMVVLAYDGADHHQRSTTLTFAPQPATLTGERATYALHLGPRATQEVTLTIATADDGPPTVAEQFSGAAPTSTPAHERHSGFQEALAGRTQIATSSEFLNAALGRSFADIAMLATADHGDLYISAGVPWYVTLFGRDSAITAFEVLAYAPEVARTTLNVLARYQGRAENTFTEEEPGKIMHELRLGEKANLHEIPQIPYFGTVDATEWFLMLLAEYVRWTGDLAYFHRLREHVERALGWIDANPQRHKTPFLAYGKRSQNGLTNQGWKDSDNGIVNSDGSLVEPPVQLVEVQGYVYRAWRDCADLYRLIGAKERAAQLEQQAADLKRRFNEAYWMADAGYYALALQRGGRQAQAIASNPGQALFGGIVDDERAQAVAERLMRDDLFCGWGIRTLSSHEVAYNPLDYQVGSVWPHDNALIALGLRRYGFGEQACQVFSGIAAAANAFEHFRLPEVFDGFSRQRYGQAVHYPVACSPQAWAAGALPLLLHAVLGLLPDASHQTLTIHRPLLPDWLDWVTVRGMRVGQAELDLRFEREGNVTRAEILRQRGDLRVVIE